MRLFAAPVAALCLAACASPAAPPPPSAGPATTTAGPIDPARIDRLRPELPPGYEVTGLPGGPGAVSLWGFGPGWVADPPQCGALADPPRDATTQRGWSASGGGGIVYAFAAAGAAAPDPGLQDQCAQWTLTAGPTTGVVGRVEAPAVDGPMTVGLATDVTTTVEGGTETRSHADTFLAFVDGHVVLVAVVTDPGADQTPLSAGFAADLLAKSVPALRG